MIMQMRNHSSVAGSFQPSHKPANTNAESSFMLIEYVNFAAENFLPLIKTMTGIKQRRFLNAWL